MTTEQVERLRAYIYGRGLGFESYDEMFSIHYEHGVEWPATTRYARGHMAAVRRWVAREIGHRHVRYSLEHATNDRHHTLCGRRIPAEESLYDWSYDPATAGSDE